ncbi:hypothetical protein VKT23_015468 [Stygiomarasmius scandens]|uniref:G domain-containing protein n=1 Tax=Marasmiellus scandens TaxID=2682957 RepID=A0ABR1J2A1_9AGAR
MQTATETSANGSQEAMILLMGPTGTGKSTFIKFFNPENDDIHIGHDLESQTIDITTSIYIDEEAQLAITLVDTPGFDDSREGVTDTDILGKIAAFLQDEGGRKLNGIIYLHRISDPRMGATTKKNLRMFTQLCGENNFGNLRIVTTNWSHVDETEGNRREASLIKGAFKPLLDGGAVMHRQDKELESARQIINELKYKSPVTLKIQEELNAGRALGDTSAGAVIIEEMKELQKKHVKELEDLKNEMEEAMKANDDELQAELDEERQKLEEMMARAEQDQRMLLMVREVRSEADAEMFRRALHEHTYTEPNGVSEHISTARPTEVYNSQNRTRLEGDERVGMESGNVSGDGVMKQIFNSVQRISLGDLRNLSFTAVWNLACMVIRKAGEMGLERVRR